MRSDVCLSSALKSSFGSTIRRSGITRETILKLARENGIEVVERSFTPDEAKEAREAFVTSTTSFVKPITKIDDRVIANGEPGAVSRRLLSLYIDHMNAIAA